MRTRDTLLITLVVVLACVLALIIVPRSMDQILACAAPRAQLGLSVSWLGDRGGRVAGAHAAMSADRRTVVRVDLLGVVAFTTGTTFADTEIGGLSAIAYDADQDVYYALSDDRSQINAARFYTLTIDIADGALGAGDVVFRDVITLTNSLTQPFAPGDIDPEGLALSGNGTLYVSSEGNANNSIDPFVNEFSLTGHQLRALTVPVKFLPVLSGTTVITGVRNNLAFESLSISPDGGLLYTAVENALAQDGPQADVGQESLSRVIGYATVSGEPVREFVYVVGPAVAPVQPGSPGRNGLAELLATDNNGSFLALERAFSLSTGYTVKLYEARAQGALDVQTEDDLIWEGGGGIPYEIDAPIHKRELLDFSQVISYVDNLEGMTLGPRLPDGRQVLIVVSDNNFHPLQRTQFVALALTFETTPAVPPTIETPRTIDDEAPIGDVLLGDSADPAIWVHPSDPEQSLVIASLRDGGLVVLDLDGQVVQTITPTTGYGDVCYNNVDLVYGFDLGEESVDLAVVSDRENDTLAIFCVISDTRQLVDVTAPDILGTIFGVDDGSATAYGLATYTSLVSGKSYAFVSQGDGNLVAQLELLDNGSSQVAITVTRVLTLPVSTEDPANAQAEGMVVDRELGYLYVAVEKETGLLKFAAEPGAGNSYTLVHPIDSAFFSPGIGGLTIYYGPNQSGYLFVSSRGDSSYVVLDRMGENAYLGSFVVGDNAGIDQANRSEGADVTGMALGQKFPSGLLVVQDGADDPQAIVEDQAALKNRSTNFKFVPWEEVALTIKRYVYLPLIQQHR
jgi:myo-inositol-hexaphosphate 3-phosphohydrolase